MYVRISSTLPGEMKGLTCRRGSTGRRAGRLTATDRRRVPITSPEGGASPARRGREFRQSPSLIDRSSHVRWSCSAEADVAGPGLGLHDVSTLADLAGPGGDGRACLVVVGAAAGALQGRS